MFNILDVITIGSATRDVYLKSEGFEIRKHTDSPTGVEQCFPLGAKIEVKEVVFTTGGGGTNAAVTFSRQGLKAGCVGVVGDDFNGKEIIKELNREKVKPFFSVHKDDLTAYSVILVHPNAERTILSYKGEGQYFNSDEIKWKKLKAKWFFLDSLGGSWNLFERVFEYITARNFKIAFNPGGKELSHGLEKLKPYLAEVDIFSVNKEEGEFLLKSQTPMTNEEILRELGKLVKGIVVLTLGPEGVLVSDKKSVYKAGTPNSPRVERTGAGDAFVSGFVSQYILSSSDIVKSIQFATANASSVVAQFGPKAGILKKDDWGPWPLVEVEIK
ncbi:MAG: carbohydrate kinase family protein [Patescibacteria group bacterium]